MFRIRTFRGLRVARLAAIGLISAACVTHYKPPADSAAHALGPAGHSAPPGLTNVGQSLVFPKPGPDGG
jgi:hypothetical protein